MTAAPSPFSPTLPTFQTAYDSTSLGWLKKCARYYQYQMIDGWSPKSKGIHLAFGGWYASGVERYAHWRAAGDTHDAAVLKLIDWALRATGEYAPSPTCNMCSGTGQRPGPQTQFEHCECVDWTPWASGDEFKNRYTLLRSLVWNVDARAESPWRTVILTNGKPAVELSFSFEVFSVAGHPISLSGHIDELVENAGTVWVKDDKTTKAALDARYFAQYTPHNQMSLYSIAGRVISGRPISGVLIRAAQIGVGFTRFATQQAPRGQAVLDEWLADTKRWITLAHQYATEGHWPMNDLSCSDYGGCPFRRVCSVAPSHRRAYLEADFEHRQWNPLQVRGDDL